MEKSRFENVVSLMSDGIYAKESLFELIFSLYPSFSENSCTWALDQLLKDSLLESLGFGFYRKVGLKKETRPIKNRLSTHINRVFVSQKFCAFLISDICDFTGGMCLRDATIIEVEKKNLFSSFLSMKDASKKNLMLAPSPHDLDMYFSEGSIVLRSLFSKAPVSKDGSYRVEKLLVDLCCDKAFSDYIYGVDLNAVYRKTLADYSVNYATLLNYASRRGCYDSVLELCLNNADVNIVHMLQETIC